MIGYVRDAIVARVLTPQADPAVVPDPERRAYVDVDARPLNLTAADLDVAELETRPVEEEIGGGATLRHTLAVVLVVEDGDPVRARTRRDRITLDLVLRLMASRQALAGTADPDGRQIMAGLSWQVSYVPLSSDTPNEYATLTITVDTLIDR